MISTTGINARSHTVTKTTLLCLAASALMGVVACSGTDGGGEGSAGGAPAGAGAGGRPEDGGAGAPAFGNAGNANAGNANAGNANAGNANAGNANAGNANAAGGIGASGGNSAAGGNVGIGGADTAGTGAGGANAGGGAGGMGGIAGGDIWGGLKNPPRKSAGCNKAGMLTNGKKTIMSGGTARSYIIDIPASYDRTKPYRLFYVSHGLGGKAEDVAGPFNFFGLKPEATSAKEPAIFIAGQGLNNTWGEVDHVFFDDVTAFVKENLCVDTTRVFVTGMSMGGMYSYSLSTDRQKTIRAGVGLAPTNYNIWLPNPKLTDPIAWMQTTGSVDTYCPWVANEAQKRGSKFIALEKAATNECTIPATVPTWQSGNHVCYDFAGCKPGYPVKACTFNGPHTDSNRDPGSTTNWIAKESWAFFMQF